MGKPPQHQRKQRLGPTDGSGSGGGGGSGGFIGFGAFAASDEGASQQSPGAAQTPPTQSQTNTNATTPSNATSSTNSTTFAWTPAYTGPDDTFRSLFARIGQKKDSGTVTKALIDLSDHMMTHTSSSSSTHNNNNTNIMNRRLLVEALVHYAWLYHSKLAWSDAPGIRAESLRLWSLAVALVPRAVAGLFRTQPELLGLCYAAQSDPAREVRAVATAISNICNNRNQNDVDYDGADTPIEGRLYDHWTEWPWQEGILSLTSRIFSYGQAPVLYKTLVYPHQKAASPTKQHRDDKNKCKEKGGDAVPSQQQQHPTTEQDRDDTMEELYVRVVGNCLDCCRTWLQFQQQQQQQPNNNLLLSDISSADVSSWWSILKSDSSKQKYPSLRRKSYELISTAAAAAFTLHLLPTRLDVLLSQALSTEKDAANIPQLLETVLTVLASDWQQQQQNCDKSNVMKHGTVEFEKNNNPSNALPAAVLAPMLKILQKACYGAKADTWGPMLLPLVAQFTDCGVKSNGNASSGVSHRQWQLLHAASAGVSKTLGASDPFLVWAAVAESATFLLVRSVPAQLLEKNRQRLDAVACSVSLKVAELWLEAWTFLTTTSALTVRRATGPTAASKTRMLQDLSKQLGQLSDASQKSNCAFSAVSPWFWETGLHSANHERQSQLEVLSQVLTELTGLRISSNSTSCLEGPSLLDRLTPMIRKSFLITLEPCQISSSALPSDEAYAFFLASFKYAGPKSVFPTDEQVVDHLLPPQQRTLESFVMNDLVRWSVIHTSKLQTALQHTKSNSLVEQDFLLLFFCLKSLSSDARSSLWHSFFREIIAAKCDLGFLVSGVSVLVLESRLSDLGIDWVQCEVLDKLAKDIGSTSDTEFQNKGREHSSISDKPSNSKELEFYRLCLGLRTTDTSLIVGRDVIEFWMECVCPSVPTLRSGFSIKEESNSSLIEALLQSVVMKRNDLPRESCLRIFLASWYYKDLLFEQSSLGLSEDAALCGEFASTASTVLRNELSHLFIVDYSDRWIQSWAMRAWRIFLLCKEMCIDSLLFPVGIEDGAVWRKEPHLLFLLSRALFQHIDSAPDRLALMANWGNDDPAAYLSDLLCSLSEASDDVVSATKSRQRVDRCAMFIAAIGGKKMDQSLVEKMVRVVIKGIRSMLTRSEVDESIVRCQVAVLSQLLELLFPPLLDSNAALTVDDVKEGDQVFYITDPNFPEVSEKARIVKVHYDSQAGHFFSIQTKRSDEVQERQTLIERLRKDPRSNLSEKGRNCTSTVDNEMAGRGVFRDLIWKDVFTIDFSSVVRAPSLGELINVVMTRIGVGTSRGIGSFHYDVHRLIAFIEQKARESFDMVTNDSGRCLLSLSLTMGFGLNSPGSKSAMNQVRCNPFPLTSRIVEYYNSHSAGANKKLDSVVLSWLIIFIEGPKADYREDVETVVQSLVLLFDLASHLLKSPSASNITGPEMIACRAIRVGMSEPLCGPGAVTPAFGIQKAVSDALCFLVKAFLSCEESNLSLASQCETLAHSSVATWMADSSISLIVRSALKNVVMWNLLAEASLASNMDALCGALFSPSKRYVAYELLVLIARRGKPLYDDISQPMLSDRSRFRLQSWVTGLDEDEAVLIEEDVYIVAEWVPPNIMCEIENWDHNGFEMQEKSIIIGRLLTWLCFLRFVDASTAVHFRNRPAFVSYLGKCFAASSILNLGVLHNDAINDLKYKVTSEILDIGEFLLDKGSLDISQLATQSLFRTVEVLPSLSRRWWEDDCPTVYIGPVQALVKKYVAPEILKREFERINASTSFGSMSVSASQVSREVTATYDQDDFLLKVVISLPAAFPFRNAEVDCSKTLGIPQNRRKRWSLQMTLMLNNQGGSLQDALVLWKANVDKEFEGLEPCPVCYSVLHVKTHKLPSLECKTCHNRFHLDCLSLWFRSSGKSQCVLCQSPWQGTRVT